MSQRVVPRSVGVNTVTLLSAGWLAVVGCAASRAEPAATDEQTQESGFFHSPFGDPVKAAAAKMIDEGRRTFRFDTFGDESFWGDTLRLHQAIAGEANGGVGPGVSPATALSLGLKVDVDALPFRLRHDLRRGRVDLDDPATTLALLRLDAVVGRHRLLRPRRPADLAGHPVRAVPLDRRRLVRAGHRPSARRLGRTAISTSARSSPPRRISRRSPSCSAVGSSRRSRPCSPRGGRASSTPSWPSTARPSAPTAGSAATLLPPAFGLAGVNLHTWTGWGSVTHWNAFVANLEMHGKGTFYDPRLDDAAQFPIAAREGFGHIVHARGTGSHHPQARRAAPLSARARRARAAARQLRRRAPRRAGATLFAGKASCARCHVPPLTTEPGWNMHTAEEIGIDDFQAQRSPDERYRTTPLRGLWTHMKGGFYHDGRFATLADVIEHYDSFMSLGLTPAEKADLAQYLKSI